MTATLLPSAERALAQNRREVLTALRDLLQIEHAALLRADALALPELATRKVELLQALASSLPDGRVVAEDADDLRALAQQVANDNQRNGAMIAALLRHTEGALQVLRGVADAPGVYGPQGQAATVGGSVRAIGRA